MLVCFNLSMPNVGSWDGKWTGADNLHARVKSFRSKKDIAMIEEKLGKRSYRYDFGDGWSACVVLTEITQKEANRIKRKSTGFCGYDWMIDSILDFGKIMNSVDQAKLSETLKASE